MAVKMCVCLSVAVVFNFELRFSPTAVANTDHVAHWKVFHIHVSRNFCFEMYTHVQRLCSCDRSVEGKAGCFLLGIIIPKDFMWVVILPS